MITIERLKSLLHYEPETGRWRWLMSRRGVKAGSRAGNIHPDGYRHIMVDRQRYQSSRLAWFYMTGAWPAECIDHIDHDRDNNSWTNLRAATYSQNMHNKGMHRNNTSGIKGVCWDNRCGKWRSTITFEGKAHHLGYFADIDDAAAAITKARAEMHGDFACNGVTS